MATVVESVRRNRRAGDLKLREGSVRCIPGLFWRELGPQIPGGARAMARAGVADAST